jgi:signal transduction histidine kinase
MDRGVRPKKIRAKAKRAPARKSAREADVRIRDLEMAEAQQREAQALAREAEALERQTATAGILSVISSSPTGLQPTFEAIAKSAALLCQADLSGVHRFDGELIHFAAQYGRTAEEIEAVRQAFPQRPSRASATARCILSAAVVQVVDHHNDPEIVDTLRMFRTVLAVPMLREGRAVGSIAVARRVVKAFTNDQIDLLKTFADQAIIAIENVRLFTELQVSNRELTDALNRQTATAEILRVISRSPNDLRPVFEAILANAARLCEAHRGALLLFRDGAFETVAELGAPEVLAEDRKRPYRPERHSHTMLARVAFERRTIYIADVLAAQAYAERDPRAVAAVEAGSRSMLGVPLLKGESLVGVITIHRPETGPFSEEHISLLQTFADQAVIAIENVRLFTELEDRNNELRTRTSELTRSVEQLTALGEVGRAVSSTLDLETVLTTIVSRAVHLSGLDGGVIFEYDEDAEEFVQRAMSETGGALAEARRTARIRKGEGVLGRTAITLLPVQVADIAMPGAYEGRLREILIDAGVRAVLAVPIVREDRLIGCLGVTRNRPGDFPTETIDLLRTFATQSALAIQNARLFHEIDDKSRQLEAASRHRSEFLANMSHELRTPLNAIIGYSELLEEEEVTDLEGGGGLVPDLQKINAAAKHQLSLINDILDLSKVEAGRMELEVATFDLSTAIDNTLVLVRERADRRGIAVGSAIDDRVGAIRADERKVKQVLLNLLSNAVKFTPAGGRIDVRAAAIEGAVEVSVADTGSGIAPEDQETIFEEFRQVGAANRKVEGTGLGLALARRFVELHGGSIGVESQIGQGSTFTFTLPVRREQ